MGLRHGVGVLVTQQLRCFLNGRFPFLREVMMHQAWKRVDKLSASIKHDTNIDLAGQLNHVQAWYHQACSIMSVFCRARVRFIIPFSLLGKRYPWRTFIAVEWAARTIYLCVCENKANDRHMPLLCSVCWFHSSKVINSWIVQILTHLPCWRPKLWLSFSVGIKIWGEGVTVS